MDLTDQNLAHWTAFGILVCPVRGDDSVRAIVLTEDEDGPPTPQLVTVGDPVECDLVEGEVTPLSIGSPARTWCEAVEFRCAKCGMHALVVKREIKERPDELLEP